MAGEVASMLISRMAVPVLCFMANDEMAAADADIRWFNSADEPAGHARSFLPETARLGQ